MKTTNNQIKTKTELKKTQSIDELAKRMLQQANKKTARFDRIPNSDLYSKKGQEERLSFLRKQLKCNLENIAGETPFDKHQELEGNIENYIGMAQFPIGIGGPVLISGSEANGDFFVPLATTEGALVASINRGIKACRMSGPISSVCLVEGIQRSPYFKFENIMEAQHFITWIMETSEKFREICSQTSQYAKLVDLKSNIEGNSVILTFEYTTGDAAGQNMVTLTTNQICNYIIQKSPVKPKNWFIESNYSGDKKASYLSFSNVRGKKVSAEIVIPRKIVNEVLKSTPEKINEYVRISTLGAIQSGTIGAQGHFANGLTAIFIACGQDVACISEASVGITRIELTSEGDLYASVTLPNLVVGTVGGGTHLPTQRECLQMMDCFGKGKARKFAEIIAAVILAGELSIVAALSVGHFAAAHQKLGRKIKS